MIGHWKKATIVACVCVLVYIVVTINVGMPSTSWLGGDNRKSAHPDQPRLQIGAKRHKIIISSLMRSGSTLTGDLFQYHPDLFYVYEPLWYRLDFLFKEEELLHHTLQEGVKIHWQKREYIPEPTDFINYMFRCNLTVYNMDFIGYASLSLDFRTKACAPKFKNMSQQLICEYEMKERCNKANGVVVKVLRLRMDQVDKMLEFDPDVKVIHLLRDPRGMSFSTLKKTSIAVQDTKSFYSNSCRRMREDLLTSKQIAKKHWGRILTVRYEDLAQNMTHATNAMYEFVGLQMPTAVRDHLREHLNFDLQKNSTAQKIILRKDPYKTAYDWRNEISFTLAMEVDDACRDIYPIMGYVSFSSEEDLRNFSFPARTDVFGEGLMTYRSTVK